MGFDRVGKLKWICGIGWIFALLVWEPGVVLGQGSKTAPPSKQTGRDKARKPTEQERMAARAREIFADAANAQNNRAYEAAIQRWRQMVSEYPNHELTSSARYYLGVCYQEQDPPDYRNAIDQFRAALKDSKLREREDALIHLGWSLFQFGATQDPPDTELLGECARVLAAFLDKYPDSPLIDRALFYAGEAEARLGRNEKAIAFYSQLMQNRGLAKSSLRSDAIFALAVAYEEASQRKLAIETYEIFLQEFPKHANAINATVRIAELALQSDRADKAVASFESIIDRVDAKTVPMADYVLYRYALALAKAGQFSKSSEAYATLSARFPQSPYAANAALAIGQTLMREKKYDDAARTFERLLAAKDERAVEASHWLCQIAILQNRAKDAVPLAREALEWASAWDPRAIHPSTASMVTLLRMDLADGLFSMAEGKSEARKLYEQIAVESSDSPVSPRATYNAAFAALQAGDHAEAQRWSEAFAKRFPADELSLDVAYVRAESLLQLSQFESAATAFEQLARSASDHPSATTWQLRGAAAKYLAGEYEGVIAMVGPLLERQLQTAERAEILFLQGAASLKLEKSQDAIRALEDSLATDSRWGQADEALLLLSQAYDANQDKEKSKQSLQRLIKEYPHSRFRQQAEVRLGQISAASGDYRNALVWYERVLAEKVDPSLLDFVRYDKSFALIQLDRFDEALVLLEDVLGTTRNSALRAESTIAKAICLRRTGRGRDAIALLEQAPTTDYSDASQPKLLYERGLGYNQQQEFASAIRNLEELVSRFPEYPLVDRAYFELAWAHRSSGDVSRATEWFQRIVDEYPESSLAGESLFHIGQMDFENRRFDSAVRAYTVAVKSSVSPEIQEQSLYKLGLTMFQQQDFSGASQQFAKQIKAFPEGSLHVDARMMIAECSFQMQNYTTAWPQYESARKAMENQPGFDSIHDRIRAVIYLHGAQTARELKKWGEVDAWTARLLEVMPDTPYKMVAKYEQAFARQSLKRVDEAISIYEEIAENERTALGARARFMIGEAYFADRNFAKAVSEFQKVMYGFTANDATDEVKAWQARSAFEAGRCSEIFIDELTGDRRRKAAAASSKYYEYIVENHPDHEMAALARQRIDALSKSK
jgi:TolA-binding protein